MTRVGDRAHLPRPDIDAGHDLMITEPGAVTGPLLRTVKDPS
ncbi:hypothetical protein AB0I81_51765 [Nonomuraea sp. NPDC050404]